MMKYFYTLTLSVLLTVSAVAQELRCNVTVNASKIQGTNKNVFSTLQTALNEFVAGTKWTNNTFAEMERIDCSFYITISEYSGSRCSGSLQLQASRPVYASSYKTVIINHMDDEFDFDYVEFDRMDFDLRSFKSNITSLIAFYVYLILGIDYDTFSLKGGSAFFENAQTIVSYAQKEGYKGWNPYENVNHRNRYWIMENILSNLYSAERNAYYKYHRLGLDRLVENSMEGRKQIMQALTDIKRSFDNQSEMSSAYLKLFFDAKSDELINIFAEAPPEEKSDAYNILKTLDSFNPNKYVKLSQSEESFPFR
ncbi:MAG: DUF4835 family protein [Prevotellaceae bacterium]|jgi:hypothetical protein|nr:DUF4835 family protein [Prevotellaceae bacterium]